MSCCGPAVCYQVRAGLLLFFKDDPSLQPPGVAVLPQGAVPLEG